MSHTQAKLIINETRGTVVCEPAVIADHPLTRMRGLLGGRGLPTGEGLLLTPAPSIHTAFMRFVIDAVFLDSGLQVVKLAPHLRPWRAASARHARSVLELGDGEIARLDLEVGDRLALLDYAGAPDHADPQLARVLIVATDRRFRMLASAWLTRRGYHVTVRTGTEDIADLAARECFDVAVIDATPSLTAAAQAAARLQTVRPSLAVVAVSDDLEQGFSALPVLPKWGQFGALCAAIDHAHGDQRFKDHDHAGR
jgi:uncharacterized membrane protein (UPF0127 family)/CheY-like chemotaxis protein